MEYDNKLFPVEASVLSHQSIEEVIKSEYLLDHDTVTCRLHYRGIHDTYIVFCNNREYFFKVYRYGSRTIDEIRAEIQLLIVLKEDGIQATESVMKKDGEYINQFKVAKGLRYGVLYTSAGVKSPEQVKETDEYNRRLGQYIGSIHKAWDRIDYPVNRWHLDIPTFIDNSMNFIREYRQWYTFDIAFLEEVAKKTKERISSAFHKNKPGYGICHGDLNPGNIRLDSNDSPVLFDFDFSGYGWRAYDVSVYTNAFSLGWDNTGMKKRKRRSEAFLEGYRTVMQLSEDDFDNMYLFVPFRRIFNIGTLYISMSNTWGDNWVNTNLNDDIETLKKWTEITDF
jgi:Ser/Thr protein kinase RdoA (MazF antagonist)